MKKIAAVILALMLLTASAALAAPASVITITNPVATVTAGGQTETRPIEGLAVQLAAGAYEQIPTFQLDITGDDEKLAGAVAQIVGKHLVIQVDGTSTAVYGDMGDTYDPSLNASVAQVLPMLYQLFDLPVPQFEGLEIPLVDLTQLVANYMSGEGRFSLSADQVYDLLESMLALAEGNAQLSSQIAMIKMYLPMLRQSGMGIEIEGTVSCDGTVSNLSADIFVVQNSKRADGSITVTMNSTKNHFQVDVPMIETTFAMDYAPERTLLTVALAAMNEFDFNFRLFPQDGLTWAEFSGKADGQAFSFSLGYGAQNGADVFCMNAEADDYILGMRADTNSNGQERSGKLSVYAQNQDTTAEIVGDVVVRQEDVEIRTIANPDAAVDAANATDARMEAISTEWANAFQGVADFITKKLDAAQ